MKTLLLSEEQTEQAAEIIKRGGLVAMPTETVYGLAADAFNGKQLQIFSGQRADQWIIP